MTSEEIINALIEGSDEIDAEERRADLEQLRDAARAEERERVLRAIHTCHRCDAALEDMQAFHCIDTCSPDGDAPTLREMATRIDEDHR